MRHFMVFGVLRAPHTPPLSRPLHSAGCGSPCASSGALWLVVGGLDACMHATHTRARERTHAITALTLFSSTSSSILALASASSRSRDLQLHINMIYTVMTYEVTLASASSRSRDLQMRSILCHVLS